MIFLNYLNYLNYLHYFELFELRDQIFLESLLPPRIQKQIDVQKYCANETFILDIIVIRFFIFKFNQKINSFQLFFYAIYKYKSFIQLNLI